MSDEECDTCDGSGIAYWYGGPNDTLKSPCLQCSPFKKLEDLEAELWEKQKIKIRQAEQVEIEEHNKRIQGL